jgi:hypothetical protein
MRRSVSVCLVSGLLLLVLAGCADEGAAPPATDQDNDAIPDVDEVARGTDVANPDSDADGVLDGVEVLAGSDPLDAAVRTFTAILPATYLTHVLPAVFPGHGLYEPTIDVGDDGAIYVSAHSQEVGRNPSPAYSSLDDGATWQSMALFMDVQGEPNEQMGAPLLSDEVFIIATEGGQAWGADCCTQAHFPLVGWCANGAEVCYYNQNAYDPSQNAAQAPTCVPSPTTDRPWLAYAAGKLLMVNNPGGGPMQLAAMDLPPLLPVAYTGATWQITWNLCGSDDGHIPGIPDMRPDHFFAAPQPSDFDLTAYHLVVGNAADVMDVRQVHVFGNTHVPPAETDSTQSQCTRGGQVAFDGKGVLYFATMNNTGTGDQAELGGLHFATSTDDATSFVETTFRFPQPVSCFYMDGNRAGDGLLVNWGVIDGERTDWYMAHIKMDPDGRLRMENVMLAVDNGYEASRHVQGAALGPDGRAYMVMSANSSNPGGATSQVGDTPLEVVVQTDGPVLV